MTCFMFALHYFDVCVAVFLKAVSGGLLQRPSNRNRDVTYGLALISLKRSDSHIHMIGTIAAKMFSDMQTALPIVVRIAKRFLLFL